jgi:hypothetical protein
MEDLDPRVGEQEFAVSVLNPAAGGEVSMPSEAEDS